jgi:hypothetical protein
MTVITVVDKSVEGPIPINEGQNIVQEDSKVRNDNSTKVDKTKVVFQKNLLESTTRSKKRRKKEFQFGGDVLRSLIFDRS